MADPYQNRPWLSTYPVGWTRDLSPPFNDMLSAFAAAVAAAPQRPFLSYFGWQGTYAEADRASDDQARAFRDQGIGPGDRIALIGQNTPMFAEAVIACWKVGAIPVPGNPMYRANEFSGIFADARPSLCVCEAQVSETICAALDQAALSETPVLTYSVWERGDGDARVLPPPPSASPRKPRRTASATRIAGAVPHPESLGLILYTSGTTGRPKGVMLTHRSMAFNARAMGEWGGVGPDSIILGVAPLFHITGFISHLCMAIVEQAQLVLTYRFEPGVVLDTIRRERPTYTVAAITVYNALMNVAGAHAEDFASLLATFSGGAAIAPAMVNNLRETIGVDLRPCYGMTETCSPTHAAPPGATIPVDPESGALAIGIPIFSTEARIAGADGRPLPIGETGELWMRGPQIMLGYWNNPDESAAALSDGWMKSGDVGFMDAQGWFYIVDRKKDMINASGFKVWPREVEDCLYAHPAVLEAAVIGAPDPYRGETVLAYVSLKPGASADQSMLVVHCRKLLAAYKCPRAIHIVDDLPKTATGKIQRHALREQAPS